MTEYTHNQYLIRAISDGDLEGVNAAIAQGADVNVGVLIGDDEQWTPLNFALGASSSTLDVVEALLDAGADINSQGSIGVSHIWDAIALGHYHFIELLIDRGADLDAVDEGGQTLLEWCGEREEPRALIEEALLKREGEIKQTTAPIDNNDLTL